MHYLPSFQPNQIEGFTYSSCAGSHIYQICSGYPWCFPLSIFSPSWEEQFSGQLRGEQYASTRAQEVRTGDNLQNRRSVKPAIAITLSFRRSTAGFPKQWLASFLPNARIIPSWASHRRRPLVDSISVFVLSSLRGWYRSVQIDTDSFDRRYHCNQILTTHRRIKLVEHGGSKYVLKTID